MCDKNGGEELFRTNAVLNADNNVECVKNRVSWRERGEGGGGRREWGGGGTCTTKNHISRRHHQYVIHCNREIDIRQILR